MGARADTITVGRLVDEGEYRHEGRRGKSSERVTSFWSARALAIAVAVTGIPGHFVAFIFILALNLGHPGIIAGRIPV